jgi:hypothetical protein
MNTKLFKRNAALVESNTIDINNKQWLNIISKGHNFSDINELVSEDIVTNDDGPILTYIAFNHDQPFQRCWAIYLLSFSSPKISLEALPRIALSDPSNPVVLEALNGLARLSNNPEAFKVFIETYIKIKSASIRKNALNDFVEIVLNSERPIYDTWVNVAEFLSSLISKGPKKDASFAMEEIESRHFPLEEYEDTFDLIQEALVEATARKGLEKRAFKILSTLNYD